MAKTIGIRLLIMYALLAIGALVVFSIIPFEKPLFIAMLLAYSMPAPFIVPLYVDVTGHADYISTTLSVQTLVSIALFIGIAAYSLAWTGECSALRRHAYIREQSRNSAA